MYYIRLFSQAIDKYINTHVPIVENINAGGCKNNYIGLITQILIIPFIFLTPFPHTTTIRNIFIYLSFFFFIFNVVYYKKRIYLNTPLLIPLLLFLCWSIISSVFSNHKLDSLHDLYAHFIFYIVYYYVVINTFTERKHLLILSRIIVMSGAIFSSGAMLHFYYYLGHSIKEQLGINLGLLYAINVIGYLLVISAIFSIRMSLDTKKPFCRYAFILAGIISGCALILTGSRGTYLAFIAAAGILLIRRKKLLVCSIAILIITSLTFPTLGNRIIHAGFGNRLVAYFYSFEFIKEHPIIGSGFAIDTYSIENLSHVEEYRSRIPEKYRPLEYLWPPHNMLLCVAVRLGPIGLMLFIYILFKPVSMCLSLARYGENEFILNWALCLLSAFMVILIKGLFEPIFTHFVDTLFYTILAMITILWNLNYRQPQEP